MYIHFVFCSTSPLGYQNIDIPYLMNAFEPNKTAVNSYSFHCIFPWNVWRYKVCVVEWPVYKHYYWRNHMLVIVITMSIFRILITIFPCVQRILQEKYENIFNHVLLTHMIKDIILIFIIHQVFLKSMPQAKHIFRRLR